MSANPNGDKLDALVEEVRLLREAFDSFSSEGFPLKSSTPTNEMVMTAAVVAALLVRDGELHPMDLKKRLDDAMVIAFHAVASFDSFHRTTRTAQLENNFANR